jgi:glycosyltransferase involved in cell wall biosynthesis
MGEDFEVIVLTDNGEVSTGEKRNRLIRLSLGEYVSFIDDDDLVELTYIDDILSATLTGHDVICFDAIRYVDGVEDREVKYSANFQRDFHDKNYYYRLPNHLMAFRKSILPLNPFPNLFFGEDSQFAKDVKPLIKNEVQLRKVLYHYLYTEK